MATKLTAKNKADVALYEKALVAGNEALAAATPTPMIVGEAKSLFSDEIDYDKPTHFIEGGCCGFAWVNIKSKDGGLKFVNSLKKVGLASSNGRTAEARVNKDSYYGGYSFWVREGGQSLERKEAFGRAFAGVLLEGGLTAYNYSRMD